MKIDWTKVKEGLTTMDVLKEENKELKEEIERLNKENEELKKIQCTFLGTGCKAEIKRLNNIIKKLERLVDDYAWNSYYIKCGNRYLKSEILNDIREIIELKGSDK